MHFLILQILPNDCVVITRSFFCIVAHNFVSLETQSHITMENIIRRMRELYPISDEALNLFTACLKKQTIAPKTIIIQSGKLNRNVYFIEKGLTRSFTLFDGKEITSWFSMEGDAACSSFSLYRNQPGFESVETLEETEAYVITTQQLTELYNKYIDIANWARVLQQENFLLLQDIHIARLHLSATERYQKMMKEFPNICNRVNLGYIASFLGITLPSLSRIRASRTL